MRVNLAGCLGSGNVGPIASYNCHCVGEMSNKRQMLSRRPVFDTWPDFDLVTPRCQTPQCSAIALMSLSRIHMSAGVMITWFMPMLLAALVAKCPHSSDCSWNAFSRCDQIHITRIISISWSSMRKTRT